MSHVLSLSKLSMHRDCTGLCDVTTKQAIGMKGDHQLLSEMAKGDGEALREFIGKWKKPIYAFFLRSLFNNADAEDLSQTFFFRIFRAAGTYTPKAKVSTWLFTIARNLLIDHLKKCSRRPKEGMLSGFEVADEGKTNVGEWHEILNNELKKLPENHRTALLLRVQQEWSYQEIAEMMNSSESNVKTWIYRARTVLKKAIKPQI